MHEWTEFRASIETRLDTLELKTAECPLSLSRPPAPHTPTRPAHTRMHARMMPLSPDMYTRARASVHANTPTHPRARVHTHNAM
jgi:hypothetical protein